MPIEKLQEESLPKNPMLELAQILYLLTTKTHVNDPKLSNELMSAIEAHDMAPFYLEVCKTLNWKIDEVLLAKMKKANEEKLEKLDEAIEDAKKNLGETEVKDAYLARFNYLSLIGVKLHRQIAEDALIDVLMKTLSLGQKLDMALHFIRIGLFYLDHEWISKYLDMAKDLIEEGCDWDRRNRLRVYQGLCSLVVRDFKSAAELFLSTISTFTCYELTDYKTFVAYTVICSMISLPRVELREKVIKGSEILEVLHSMPNIQKLLFSLYNCQYADFFTSLAWLEDYLKADRYFSAHYRYYIREMRILAYNQLLESYRSLTLQYMASVFGVTVSFIDSELSRFIAAERLHCKIDQVNGIVETNRPDSKNFQYQACIKQGDILLNRIQKLSRVINI